MHGAARVTADIDVTVRLAAATTAQLVTCLRAHHLILRFDDPAFVASTRVLPVIHEPTSVPVDIVLAGPGLEDLFLERAEMRDLGGVMVPVARAEDLIAMKILAGRDKDLEDVAAIVTARLATLDTALVSTTLSLVQEALGQHDLMPVWERLAPPSTAAPRSSASSSAARLEPGASAKPQRETKRRPPRASKRRSSRAE